MDFTLEFEQEADGRWLAEVPELPGVLATVSREMKRSPRRKLWPFVSSLSVWNTLRVGLRPFALSSRPHELLAI